MHERELGAELGRFLDGFGPYDGRHTAAMFERLPGRGRSARAALALIGAVLMTAVVVAALLAPRWMSLAHPAVPAAVSTARAPASPSPGLPPSPAFVATTRGSVSTWVRVDWSGHRLGAVEPPPGTTFLNASPDGRLALAAGTAGAGYTLIDAAGGHVIATMPIDVTGVRWADDSRHLCGLAARGGSLVVVAVDAARGVTGRRVFPVHLAGPGEPSVLACSGESDRAVLTRFWMVGRTELAGDVEVLRLSTGATLLHHAFPAPVPFVNVDASADGRYLVGWPPDGSQSTFVDLLTGQTVAHVNGMALGFTADDRYVAVSTVVSEAGKTARTGSLVEWRTGRVAWTDRGQLGILGAQPDGDAIAVDLSGPDQTPSDHDAWLILHPDGSTIAIGSVP